MRIRDEEGKDRAAVRELVSAEFDTGGEADLVEALRAEADPWISLVAEEDGAIIGHVMFSPVTVDEHPDEKLMGMAPLAVLYGHQNRGVGSKLVRAGLERCRELGFRGVVVVGHPDYYPRFGFAPAARYGLTCEYDVPESAFLALELEPGALAGTAGTVRYHAAFGRL